MRINQLTSVYPEELFKLPGFEERPAERTLYRNLERIGSRFLFLQQRYQGIIRKEYLSLKKYKHLWNKGTMYRSVGSVTSETVRFYIENSNNWLRAKQRAD